MATYQPGRAAGLAGIINPQQRLGASYAVLLPVFEGPLDLLLHLIEQEKLDISAVSLVAVTDQYLKTLEQLEELEELRPGALADFLVVASRLLYIKSASLLPKPPSSAPEDEEESVDTLVRHLLDYRQFKRVAESLRGLELAGGRVFVRPPLAVAPAAVSRQPVASRQPVEFGAVDGAVLQKALQRALARIPEAPAPPKVQPYTVTVAERIETVRQAVCRVGEEQPRPTGVRFSTLLGEATSRVEIIVTFLAVLELVKQREVVAAQVDTFGEIVLLPNEAVVEEPPVDLAAAAQPEE